MDSGDNENVMKHGHPQALEAAIDMSVKKCLSANRYYSMVKFCYIEYPFSDNSKYVNSQSIQI